MTCKCHSYNWEIGERPEVIVPLPDVQFRMSHRQNRLVCLDACAAETIVLLWDFGVLTLGVCCGHGRSRPEIVLHERTSPERVRRILSMVDDRGWGLLQWIDDKLTDVTDVRGAACERPEHHPELLFLSGSGSDSELQTESVCYPGVAPSCADETGRFSLVEGEVLL